MDIHPILVHFPIAFLTLYAVLECIRPRALLRSRSWFLIKALLVTAGFAAALAAWQSGRVSAEIFSPGVRGELLRAHEWWAGAVAVIFGPVAGCYAALFLKDRISSRWGLRGLAVARAAERTFFIVPVVIAGLAAITITGALGGAMVYSPAADPVVTFVYHAVIGF